MGIISYNLQSRLNEGFDMLSDDEVISFSDRQENRLIDLPRQLKDTREASLSIRQDKRYWFIGRHTGQAWPQLCEYLFDLAEERPILVAFRRVYWIRSKNEK